MNNLFFANNENRYLEQKCPPPQKPACTPPKPPPPPPKRPKPPKAGPQKPKKKKVEEKDKSRDFFSGHITIMIISIVLAVGVLFVIKFIIRRKYEN